VDRDDARFVVHTLDSRISCDRESLDHIASTSVVQLVGTAARVRALAAGWPPAIVAASELEAIARLAGKVVDEPCPSTNLIIFVDKLRGLIDEPAQSKPLNRRQRRAVGAAGRVLGVPAFANAAD
jgi:hypothetical protein